MYCLVSASTFLIATLEDGNLFCDKYMYMSLKNKSYVDIWPVFL